MYVLNVGTIASPNLVGLLRDPVNGGGWRGRSVLLLGVLALTLLAGASACGTDQDRYAADGSTLRMLYWGDERAAFAPLRMPSQFLLYLPLVAYDEAGEVQGRLARAWTHSDDYRAWTFHLRTGVRWHDGVPVTARDVEFTYDLFDAVWGLERDAEITVHNDSTFTVRYGKPTDALDWWMVYLPRHRLEGLDPERYEKWGFWREPVGNGPYRYVRHLPKTMVELEANPDHYGGKPRIERVVMKFGESALTELLSGNVDIAFVGWGDVQKLDGDPRFEVYGHIMPEVDWLAAIFWNHRDPLFGDPRVRRALTLAIDRVGLRQVIDYPVDVPLFDAPFTPRQFRRGELLAALPHDLEGAEQLLREAGWARDGGGTLRKEGREFRFTALVPAQADRQRAAVYIQAQLRQSGIRMDVRPVDGAVAASRLRTGDFQAVFFRFHNSSLGSSLGAGRMFGADSPLGYVSPRVADLLERAESAIAPGLRDEIFRELMHIFRVDMPVTFLQPEMSAIAAHRRVRGLRSPWTADPATHMERLWLEDDS